jgi:hypothetical protein
MYRGTHRQTWVSIHMPVNRDVRPGLYDHRAHRTPARQPLCAAIHDMNPIPDPRDDPHAGLRLERCLLQSINAAGLSSLN